MPPRHRVEVARISGELLTADIATGSDITRIRLVGELDLSTENLVTRASTVVLHWGASRVFVDLKELTFCDVRGVDALLTLRTQHMATGASVCFVGASNVVQLVFGALGLASVLGSGPVPDNGCLS
jgi:anti-anti-sigma factor